jgi:hypothetical protein
MEAELLRVLQSRPTQTFLDIQAALPQFPCSQLVETLTQLVSQQKARQYYHQGTQWYTVLPPSPIMSNHGMGRDVVVRLTTSDTIPSDETLAQWVLGAVNMATFPPHAAVPTAFVGTDDCDTLTVLVRLQERNTLQWKPTPDDARPLVVWAAHMGVSVFADNIAHSLGPLPTGIQTVGISVVNAAYYTKMHAQLYRRGQRKHYTLQQTFKK